MDLNCIIREVKIELEEGSMALGRSLCYNKLNTSLCSKPLEEIKLFMNDLLNKYEASVSVVNNKLVSDTETILYMSKDANELIINASKVLYELVKKK